MCMATVASAQPDTISRLFSDLESDRSNTVITISGMMFDIFKNIDVEDEEDQELADAMSKLTGLKILSKSDVRDGFQFYRDALQRLDGNYEKWMGVREPDQDLSFYIKKNGNRVSELVMFSGSDSEFFMMSIMGDIDLSQISKISKSMDIEGMDKLEKADKKGNN